MQSHPTLMQLKLHEYMDCLTLVASHCTYQMQPPNAAITRPLDTQYVCSSITEKLTPQPGQ